MNTTASEGAPRWQAVLFTAIPAFGIAAAVALMLLGGQVQPLGSPQTAPPAVSTSAPEGPSEPTAEEPLPAPEPEPSTQPAPEPEAPTVPVDMGPPTSELGLALVAEFGEGTTFWRGAEQVRDPQRGDTFRSAYLPTSYVGELAQWYVGTDDYWLLVEMNSEAEGLEVLIKK